MAQARHLANAPITEAIFDFQVKARPDLRGQELEDIFPLVQDRFPNKHPQKHQQKSKIWVSLDVSVKMLTSCRLHSFV